MGNGLAGGSWGSCGPPSCSEAWGPEGSPLLLDQGEVKRAVPISAENRLGGTVSQHLGSLAGQ